MSSRHKNSEGDWTCSDPNCSNLNFARRTSCNRCGKEKSYSDSKSNKQGVEIGKLAAEKSHGLFSADDWQCSKCGNVNWARRQTCNMCNAPKFGEVEERTGYGGGFNEREGVEYIKRDDSDDEYDEFGRKKKQFRTLNSQEISSKMLEVAEKKKVQEDSDEEEEDDDCDLSKYDIWGDDDDVSKDEGQNGKIEDKNEENEHSPSQQSFSSSSQSSKSSVSRSRSRSSSSGYSRSRSRSRDRRYRSRSRDKYCKRKHSSRSSSRSPSTNKKAR